MTSKRALVTGSFVWIRLQDLNFIMVAKRTTI